MIYLIDDTSIPTPDDCTDLIYIGFNIPEGMNGLEPEEQAMFDHGAKVQFWHQRNAFVMFKVLTNTRSRYGKYVSDRHFD